MSFQFHRCNHLKTKWRYVVTFIVGVVLMQIYVLIGRHELNIKIKPEHSSPKRTPANGIPRNNDEAIRKFSSRVIRILKWAPPVYNWVQVGREQFKDCATAIPCEYTNQSSYNSSDIIMINAFHLIYEQDMPPFRLPHQKWMFYHTEAPRVNRFRRLTRYHSSFNMTLTYSINADIPKLYGICLPNRDTIKNNPRSVTDYIRTVYGSQTDTAPWLSREKPYVSYNRAAGKSRLVAWMVSDCTAKNKRSDYVKLLQRHIPVDIYGKCGNLTCLPRLSNVCEDRISRKYKFYLSFENSLCPEYITEKLWRKLKRDIVPVVLGGAEYERYLPKHSYINIRDFSSPKDLGNYLVLLDKNDTLYNEYFLWKKAYTCHTQSPGISMACLICHHANKHINKIEIVKNVAKFWSGGECMLPDDYYKGTADMLVSSKRK